METINSKSSLAVVLSRLNGFSSPKLLLEQYETESEVAASTLWHAYMKGWIEGKIVADLGAGTGILGIGCLLLGAKKCFFLEKDIEAVSILKENLSELNLLNRTLIIRKDISLIKRDEFPEPAELVVQNPPFGTKIKSSDRAFIAKACELSSRIISFHKSSTADFVKQAFKSLGFEVAEILNFRYPLKSTYSFHKSRRKEILVSSFFFYR